MLVPLVLVAMLAAETPDASGPLLACAEVPSQSWTTVRDHHKALAFVAAVRRARIEFTEGGPFDCGLVLSARCVPDLDGDGKDDIVVRASWAERQGSDGEPESKAAEVARCHDPQFRGAGSPYSSLFLLLGGTARSPLGDVRLLEDETGAGREGPTAIAATKWRGQPALRMELSLTHETPEGGFTETRERILVVRKGRLVVAQERQLRLTH